jgi:ComF family protein
VKEAFGMRPARARALVPRPSEVAALSARLSRLGRAAADALYPPMCTYCRAETTAPHALCPDCWRETIFIAAPLCDRCGAPISGAEDAPFCDHCLNRPLAFARARAAILYEGVGRDMTLAFKHGDRLDVARPAAAWMARIGQPLIEGAEIVVPVPLHWRRLVARRFNQAAELARRIAREADLPYAPGLLRRVRATAMQRGLSREARAANLAGAFAAPPRRAAELRGRRVLLIDDVYTSGATLSACAAALREAGALRVDALCLARVAPSGGGPIFREANE